jgi:hypothetical protein
MLRSRSLDRLLWRSLGASMLGLLIVVAGAPAQTKWRVDPKYSLAWWQVSPHLNHLWATSCPEEPSWRPGEGRSGGWNINKDLKTLSTTGYQNVGDTIHVPLYPRQKVEAVCTNAVNGEATLPDTVRWRGVRGKIMVAADKMISGHDQRDAYARGAVLQATRYRTVDFTLDSVVNVTRRADTLRGTGIGHLTLHGVTNPMNAALVAWPEAGGLRVFGKFRMPSHDMVRVYGLSSYALGLGWGTKIWQDFFAGVDMLLRPEGSSSGSQ